MKYLYAAVLSPRSDGGYYVSVPDVRGCVTEGDNLADAIFMARDALAGCLCAKEDMRYEIPAARKLQDIPVDTEQDIRTLIDIDTTRYRADTDNRIVRSLSHVGRRRLKCSAVCVLPLRICRRRPYRRQKLKFVFCLTRPHITIRSKHTAL